MVKFPKIETIFMRDEITKRITPKLRQSSTISALSSISDLVVEEKIDGTNAHLEFEYNKSLCTQPKIHFCSRSRYINENEDVMYIRQTLMDVVNVDKLLKWYYQTFCLNHQGEPVNEGPTVCIFGEVFGYKIQKNDYTTGQDRSFRVFDVKVNTTWLSPIDRDILCSTIGLEPVPTVTTSLTQLPSYEEFYHMLHSSHSQSLVASRFGRESALEGYIIKPKISMYTNRGRVIGKIKRTDFLTKDEYYNERTR